MRLGGAAGTSTARIQRFSGYCHKARLVAVADPQLSHNSPQLHATMGVIGLAGMAIREFF